MIRADNEARAGKKKDCSKCKCNCRMKLDPFMIFDENVEDIARSLSQIMLICGINTLKSHKAKSIVKRVFVYHEKLRTTCDPDKAKRLNRDDLLQALTIKCEMERMEALLSYAIIKRAFKAFYHGKRPFSISNPIMDALSINTQEGAWKHAAYRTARIFDNYKAAFFWAHKAYEKQIVNVYKDLYKRMKARANPLMVPTCPCRGCRQQDVFGTGGVQPSFEPYKDPRKEPTIILNECDNLPEACILCGLQIPTIGTKGTKIARMPRPITNPEMSLERCSRCNSPRLICECFIDPMTGLEYGECGQDSYKVKWYRVEDAQPGDDDYENEQQECLSDWTDHHCPIDCQNSDDTGFCRHGEEQDNSDDDIPNIDDICKTESCDDEAGEEEEDAVANLENYLNKLWAEEVAAKKNPKTYVPSLLPVPCPCQKCE